MSIMNSRALLFPVIALLVLRADGSAPVIAGTNDERQAYPFSDGTRKELARFAGSRDKEAARDEKKADDYRRDISKRIPTTAKNGDPAVEPLRQLQHLANQYLGTIQSERSILERMARLTRKPKTQAEANLWGWISRDDAQDLAVAAVRGEQAADRDRAIAAGRLSQAVRTNRTGAAAVYREQVELAGRMKEAGAAHKRTVDVLLMGMEMPQADALYAANEEKLAASREFRARRDAERRQRLEDGTAGLAAIGGLILGVNILGELARQELIEEFRQACVRRNGEYLSPQDPRRSNYAIEMGLPECRPEL